MLTRKDIADAVIDRLTAEKERLARDFSTQPIRYFAIDDLLPQDMAMQIYRAFPPAESMVLKKSLRELKFVTAQMNRHDPVLEESIFAFQDPRIVKLVGEITGVREPYPDSQLYAGGLSLMGEGHYLNPHIDNSHDRMRERYRVLNLLYYVSPDWNPANGGNLELWPDGVKAKPVTIPSLFNRLVVMHTNRRSWHSVSEVRTSAPRCCVSNYYFSPYPPEGTEEYFHVTSFRGRPEQPLRDFMLRGDIALRALLRKIRPMGVVQNKHYYKR